MESQLHTSASVAAVMATSNACLSHPMALVLGRYLSGLNMSEQSSGRLASPATEAVLSSVQIENQLEKCSATSQIDPTSTGAWKLRQERGKPKPVAAIGFEAMGSLVSCHGEIHEKIMERAKSQI